MSKRVKVLLSEACAVSSSVSSRMGDLMIKRMERETYVVDSSSSAEEASCAKPG